MKNCIKVAVAQTITNRDKSKNLAKALDYIKIAKDNKADIIIFPEVYMAFMAGQPNHVYADIAEPLDGPFVNTLSKAAQKYNIHIICGFYESPAPINTQNENNCVYNSVVLIDDDGKILHKYSKTHLYDAFSFQESKNLLASDNAIQVVKTKLGIIGLLVCYELRFPEISRTLALQGAEILIVPTAWVSGPMKEEHFLTLAQARALENTVFLCAANQTDNIYSGRSVIYNPMGVAMASRGEDEGLIYADIDVNQVKNIREKLLCLTQRRPELYHRDFINCHKN